MGVAGAGREARAREGGAVGERSDPGQGCQGQPAVNGLCNGNTLYIVHARETVVVLHCTAARAMLQ
eukprot:1026744-Rhodomonas_salina.2